MATTIARGSMMIRTEEGLLFVDASGVTLATFRPALCEPQISSEEV